LRLIRFVTDCLASSKAGQFAVPTFSPSLPSISTYGRSDIMKIFVQTKNESLVINDEIVVTVLDVNDENVILAVDAPEWIAVCEEETLERSESMLVHPR
jgi:carbon storage regulator CsrA